MADIEDQATKLAPILQRLEAFQGSVELAAAVAVQVKRVHDGSNARQQRGGLGSRGRARSRDLA
ncbi:hypothetical protein [Microvirga sp. TS319]|uniref:hypothetical protein n=1 Tax=Microvirga sp. TS319 TaxID=3241165 RepID=UPI00351AA421